MADGVVGRTKRRRREGRGRGGEVERESGSGSGNGRVSVWTGRVVVEEVDRRFEGQRQSPSQTAAGHTRTHTHNTRERRDETERLDRGATDGGAETD